MNTTHVQAVSHSTVRRKKFRKDVLMDTVMGYLFTGPMLLGLFVLTLFPILASVLLSFTNWNFVAGMDRVKFIGLDNYVTLFKDDVFRLSLSNNLKLLLTVPITMALSLTLAVLIDRAAYWKSLFKVVFFMPYISSIVAVAIVFQVIFHPSYGPVNQTLMALGVEKPPTWMADPDVALYCVMAILIWISIGYQMIIYMAGLQSIPKDLYEAAEIDGASTWRKFVHITIPQLSPTSFFLLVTGIISTFKVFDVIIVLTNGGPANSTTVVVHQLYEKAFIDLKSGYSSAMAIVLLIFVLLITLLQWLGQRRWVNY